MNGQNDRMDDNGDKMVESKDRDKDIDIEELERERKRKEREMKYDGMIYFITGHGWVPDYSNHNYNGFGFGGNSNVKGKPILYDSAGDIIDLENIFNMFCNQNCSYLKHKPKVFIVDTGNNQTGRKQDMMMMNGQDDEKEKELEKDKDKDKEKNKETAGNKKENDKNNNKDIDVNNKNNENDTNTNTNDNNGEDNINANSNGDAKINPKANEKANGNNDNVEDIDIAIAQAAKLENMAPEGAQDNDETNNNNNNKDDIGDSGFSVMSSRTEGEEQKAVDANKMGMNAGQQQGNKRRRKAAYLCDELLAVIYTNGHGYDLKFRTNSKYGNIILHSLCRSFYNHDKCRMSTHLTKSNLSIPRYAKSCNISLSKDKNSDHENNQGWQFFDGPFRQYTINLMTFVSKRKKSQKKDGTRR